jgi:hypothetical protein
LKAVVDEEDDPVAVVGRVLPSAAKRAWFERSNK